MRRALLGFSIGAMIGLAAASARAQDTIRIGVLEFGTAAALSTILLVTSGAAVYVVFRVSGRNESAFL